MRNSWLLPSFTPFWPSPSESTCEYGGAFAASPQPATGLSGRPSITSSSLHATMPTACFHLAPQWVFLHKHPEWTVRSHTTHLISGSQPQQWRPSVLCCGYCACERTSSSQPPGWPSVPCRCQAHFHFHGHLRHCLSAWKLSSLSALHVSGLLFL